MQIFKGMDSMKSWFNKIVCITLMLFTLLTGGCFKKYNGTPKRLEWGVWDVQK